MGHGLILTNCRGLLDEKRGLGAARRRFHAREVREWSWQRGIKISPKALVLTMQRSWPKGREKETERENQRGGRRTRKRARRLKVRVRVGKERNSQRRGRKGGGSIRWWIARNKKRRKSRAAEGRVDRGRDIILAPRLFGSLFILVWKEGRAGGRDRLTCRRSQRCRGTKEVRSLPLFRNPADSCPIEATFASCR